MNFRSMDELCKAITISKAMSLIICNNYSKTRVLRNDISHKMIMYSTCQLDNKIQSLTKCLQIQIFRVLIIIEIVKSIKD